MIQSPKGKLRRRTPGEMNKIEAWYHDAILLPALNAGRIQHIGFEQMGFRLVHNTQGGKNGMMYYPDFFVEFPGHMELHEIKTVSHSKKTGKKWSSAKDDAIAKLKMASELFPMFVWKLVEVEKETVTETIF